MKKKSVCAQAKEQAEARDAVQGVLLTLLGEQIASHEREKIHDRVNRLTEFFESISGEPANQLRKRLDDRRDPLANYFDCELRKSTREQLRALLNRPRTEEFAPQPKPKSADRNIQNRIAAPMRPTPPRITTYPGVTRALILPYAKPPLRRRETRPEDELGLPQRQPRSTIELLELAYAVRNDFLSGPQNATKRADDVLRMAADYLKELDSIEEVNEQLLAIYPPRDFIKNMGGQVLGTLYTRNDVLNGVRAGSQEVGRLRGYIAIQKDHTRKQEFDRLIAVIESNFDFLEVAAGEAISFELARDGPVYRQSLVKRIHGASLIGKREWRVMHWLRSRRRQIRRVADRFRVDRRAIAAVIAWEALHNVQRASVQSVGPGKMHLYSSPKWYLFFGVRTNAIPQQLEKRGYITPRGAVERERYMSTLEGALEYIAASMHAASQVTSKISGVDISNNLALLTHFYQAHDLDSWETWVTKNRERINDAHPETPIPQWLRRNAWMLERVLGKPKK